MKNSTRILIALLSGITVLSGIPSVRGQEMETAFYPQGRITTITSEMESKVHLFPNSVGFQEARLFELPDSSFVIDIASEHDGKTFHARKPLTRDSLTIIDSELKSRLLLYDPALLQDQSGRADFLLGMAGLSLVVYGPSLAVLTATGEVGRVPWASGYSVPEPDT
jgi:hypothetical protein